MEHIVRKTLIAAPAGNKLQELWRQGTVAFCDIETLGLNAADDPVILAAFGYFTGAGVPEFTVEQFFAATPMAEGEILRAFFRRIGAFQVLVTFNGQRFDVPFLKRRAAVHGVAPFLPQRHFDIYQEVCRYKGILNLERYNLKTLEQYLGIAREDRIDGATSIVLYQQYLCCPDPALRHAILLHNYEDICNLPQVMRIFDRLPTVPPPSAITPRQAAYLTALLAQRRLRLAKDMGALSKTEASWLIDCLVHGRELSDEYVQKLG